MFVFKSEPDLLVAVCVALANGLIAPWLPHEHMRALQIPSLTSEVGANQTGKADEKKRTTTISQPAAATVAKPFVMTSEASSDFKKALEVTKIKKIKKLIRLVFCNWFISYAIFTDALTV